MKCKQCGKVPLSGDIENWDNFICQDCKDFMIERLEEVSAAQEKGKKWCCEHAFHCIVPLGLELCAKCCVKYIKTGKPLTKEDLENETP